MNPRAQKELELEDGNIIIILNLEDFEVWAKIYYFFLFLFFD